LIITGLAISFLLAARMLLPRLPQLLVICLVAAIGTIAAVEYQDPNVKTIPVRLALLNSQISAQLTGVQQLRTHSLSPVRELPPPDSALKRPYPPHS
jgi:hypothetical protein